MIKTKILRINRKKISKTAIRKAAEVIRKGGLVAFPTETVYGLGANALDKKAVLKIFKAKGRPADNPIIVHVSDLSQLAEVAEELPLFACLLIKKFWPGPLTLVLNKKKSLPKEVTGGLDTVAVRMPKNRIALELIREAGVPIAAPSANIAGKPSPTNAKHVLEDLNRKIDYILDGGRTKIGVESTVLDVTTSPPTLLRPGAVTKEQIEKLIGKIAVAKEWDPNAPKSPGTKYRHYAPRAKMIICKDEEEIKKKLADAKKKGTKIAVLRFDKSPEKIAKNLFAVLRRFDSKGVEVILCEPLEKIKKQGIGLAVRDRLKRAANRH